MIETMVSLVGTVGFPIACCLGMAYFIFHIYKTTTKANEQNMEKVQARCKEREEKLYQEIDKNREINEKAIATIAHYADRLDIIQNDIKDIKTDITTITAKIE